MAWCKYWVEVSLTLSRVTHLLNFWHHSQYTCIKNNSADLGFELVSSNGALQLDVRDAKKSQVVARPVTQCGHLFRHLCLCIKICKQHTALVWCKCDKDMPETVEVWEADGLPGMAEYTITGPAEQSTDPHQKTSYTKVENTLWIAPTKWESVM